MSKILLLNANLAEVGTYYRALYFGREPAHRGHAVVMMTVSRTSRWRPVSKKDASGLTIIECPNFMHESLPWHCSGWLDIWLRLKVLFTGNYDLVYAFEYQPNISAPVFFTKFIKKYRLVSDWCDWHAGASNHFGGKKWAHAIDRFFEERIRHHADHLTTINYLLRDRAVSIGIPEERITVIREGVDPDYITPLDMCEMRTRLDLPESAKIVGTIVDSPLGNRLLLEMIIMLKGRLPEIRLLIIGKIPSETVKLVDELGLDDWVILPGRVSDEDLPRYLATADILALPLEDNLVNRGRWPHKLGDMLAARRPVLVSPGGEFPSMLGEKDCAIVLPLAAYSYATTIEAIINNPAAYKAMAERGRSLILDELNWTRIGEQIESVIRKTLGAR